MSSGIGVAVFVWSAGVSEQSHVLLQQVRFRTALLVQAACVVTAASNAAAVCSSCCSTFMSPTFCLLKALATQASSSELGSTPRKVNMNIAHYRWCLHNFGLSVDYCETCRSDDYT